VALVYTTVRSREIALPLIEWVRDGRDPDGAPAAWRQAVSLPRQMVVRNGFLPFAIVSAPTALYFAAELELPLYSAAIVLAAGLVAVAYAAVLHFFVSELFLRPVVSDICERLPRDFPGSPVGERCR